MALIKCNECKKSVSDKAYFCPHCGYPIAEYIENNNDDKEVGSEINAIAICGFILSIFAIFIHFIAIISCVVCVGGIDMSRDLKGRGYGLSLAGLVISIIFLFVMVIGFLW